MATRETSKPRKTRDASQAKNGSSHGEPSEGAFVVVLEDIRSQFKVFGEALQGMNDRLNGMDERMTTGFAQIDARFAQVDARFEQIDARFDRVERDLGLVKVAVLEHGRELRDIRTTLARVDTRLTHVDVSLDTKVTRDEVEAIVERAVARQQRG